MTTDAGFVFGFIFHFLYNENNLKLVGLLENKKHSKNYAKSKTD